MFDMQRKRGLKKLDCNGVGYGGLKGLWPSYSLFIDETI